MKTIIKKFSLTAFIKNVQSTLAKVDKFVLQDVEYILVLTGLFAKVTETILSDF